MSPSLNHYQPPVSTPGSGSTVDTRTLLETQNWPYGSAKVGLFNKDDVRVYHGVPKRIFVAKTASDLTVSGTGAASNADTTITNLMFGTTTPRLTVTSGNTGNWKFANRATPVDVVGHIIRVPFKITDRLRGAVSIQLANTGGLAAGNYVSVQPYHTNEVHIKNNDWMAIGAHWKEFVATGSGADMKNITEARFRATASGGTLEFWAPWIEIVPVHATRAKCTIWFDDGREDSFKEAALAMIDRSLPGVLAPTLATIDSGTAFNLSSDWMRKLNRDHGWQIACHAYSDSAHANPATGDEFRSQMAQVRHFQIANGLTGHSDFAYYGSMPQSGEVYESVKTMFRSARQFTTDPRHVETLPPIDPWRMKGYGTEGTSEPLGDLTAYVDKAIAQRGLCQFVYHEDTGGPFTGLLDYLVARRDEGLIDIVTLDDLFYSLRQPLDPHVIYNYTASKYPARQPVDHAVYIGPVEPTSANCEDSGWHDYDTWRDVS